MRNVVLALALFILLSSCESPPQTYVKLGPKVFPNESYEHPPDVPIDANSYVITPNQMTGFYDAPGEAGYFAFGSQYGFDSLSFVITETHPQGGPPLHTHAVEEAHILLSGSIDYVIGEQRFTATAPYIARVPANVPHTFVNSGSTPLNLIGVFSRNDPGYEQLGPNPLIEQ